MNHSSPEPLPPSSEAVDEILGEHLDLYLEGLCSGTPASAAKPEAGAEIDSLKGVVEQLQSLDGYLAGLSVGGPAAATPETIDYCAPPAAPDTKPTAYTLDLAARRAEPDVTGPQVGKFQIVRKLGRGGQGGAYLAFDPDLHRHVVIKLYHQAQTTQEQEGILREGQALARVRSPYVASCLSAERHAGVPYLVVEYVPGKNLGELRRSRPLPLARVLELTRQVAEGLAAVHACGLLHRDVKPANILVGDDDLPRLVDFGLAAPLGGDALHNISGTLAYMAPEQARGEAERIDPRTDLFGLGAVLYELLTGRPPYQAEDTEALWEAARTGDVVPPRQLRPGLPAAVNELCMRCLARHPGNRFASASELAQTIRRYENRQQWAVRAKIGLLAGAAAAVLLGAVWYFSTLLGDGPDTPLVQAPADDGSAPRKKTPVRPAINALRHPNGRKLRQDFPILMEVIDRKPNARGQYSITEGERIRFRIRVPTAAYVAVWHYDDEGNVIQLFPNARIDQTHRIGAKQWQEIPSDDRYAFAASASRRREYLHVVASTRRWDPPASGLRGTGKDDSFLVLDPGQVENLTRGLTQVRVEKVAEAVLPFRVVPKKRP
jgi:hypothetical protein